MKNTYIAIIVLVVLVVGAALVIGMGNKAEAPVVVTPAPPGNHQACTMEAKICPDGSSVGRSGPNCEFAPCPGAAAQAPSVKEFTVTGKDFSFSPSSLTVKKGDSVKITFKNTGGTHDLVIDEFKVGTKVIQAGQDQVILFVADKAGSFQYYCSVGNHRAMGMVGTLKVE